MFKMKKIFFFAFLFFVSSLSFSQIKVKKRIYNGDSVYIYPLTLSNSSGEIQIPYLEDSLPSGKYILESFNYRDEEKTVVSRFNISNGKVNGIAFFDNGLTEIEYENGIQNGLYHEYDLIGGFEIGGLVNGVKTGKYQNFETIGSHSYLSKVGNYVNGKQNGELKYFYPNGQIRFYCSNYNQNKFNSDIIQNRMFTYKLQAGWYNYENKSIRKRLPTKKKDRQHFISLGNVFEDVMNQMIMGSAKAFTPDGFQLLDVQFNSGSINPDECSGLKTIFSRYPNGKSVFTLDTLFKDSIKIISLFEYSFSGRLKQKIEYTIVNDLKERLRTTAFNEFGSYVVAYDEYNSLLSRFHSSTTVYPMKMFFYEDFVDTTMLYFPTLDKEVRKYRSSKIKEKQSLAILDVDSSLLRLKRSIKDTSNNFTIDFYYSTDSRSYWKRGDVIPFNFSGEFFAHFFGCDYQYNVSFCRAVGRPYIFNEDSVVVKKDGLNYNGTFYFRSTKDHEKIGKIRMVKNGVVFYSTKGRSKYKNSVSIKNGKLDGPYSKGYDTLFYDEGSLEKVVEYDLKKVKPFKREKFLMSLKEFASNELNGHSVNWNFLCYYPSLKGSDFPVCFYGLKNFNTFEAGKLKGPGKIWSGDEFIQYHIDSLVENKIKFLKLPYSLLDSGSIGLQEIVNYENDTVSGVCTRFNYGDITYQCKYNNGVQYGVEFSKKMNDTLFLSHYKNGLKEGFFYKKDVTGQSIKFGSYAAGIPTGLWTFSSKYGITNAILSIDSSNIWVLSEGTRKSFRTRKIRGDRLRLSPSYGFNLDDLRYYSVSGKLKLFHSNGVTMAEGKVKSGERSEVWKYSNEFGEITEIHNYAVDSLNIDSNKIYTAGTFVEVNKKGDSLVKGELLSGIDLYDCSTDLNIRNYDKTYNLFLSNKGDTIVKDGAGYLKRYNQFSTLIAEGNVKNGLKSGAWKLYDQNGNLNEFGIFVNGKKNGVWLKGDLRAIHYENLDCTIKKDIDKDGEGVVETISINQTFYKNGLVINSESVKTYR